MAKEKLFLIDAMAMIYRAYFAFSRNPRVNSKGMNTSSVYGFTTTLFDIIRKENPKYLGVAFDTSAPTTRHLEFVEYKANRQETPEDIRSAIPIIKDLLRAFNIPVLECDGYEADDIIGTFAKKAEKASLEVYMATPDKDFGQLVSENIFLYKPAYKGPGFDVLGVDEIKAKWSIEDPIQVIDILAMMGDSVDNIPGIPGVGEKTAIKLIQTYGTLENTLDHAHELKGKLREKVESNKKLALVCKGLTTIILDVPLPFEQKELALKDWNKEALTQIFTELEFRTLGKRILGEDFQIIPAQKVQSGDQISLFGTPILIDPETKEIETNISAQSIDDKKPKYSLINNEEDLNKLIDKLIKANSICFDSETTGLEIHDSEIIGLSFSLKAGDAYYVPFSTENQNLRLSRLKPIFENDKIEKIGHNLKFDIQMLLNYGIEVKGPLFDTMLAHYLIEPESRHGLNILSEIYLNYSPIPIESLIGKKGKNQLSMKDVPLEKILNYAAEDADIALQLRDVFKPLLKERKVEDLFYNVEVPLLRVLSKMEYEGVAIDEKALANYSIQLGKEVKDIERSIYKDAGIQFNIASPKQLGDILFDRMGIEYKGKKTKTGQYSTNEESLRKIKNSHPIIEQILNYRQLQKLRSTYVDALPRLVNTKTQRVHSSFNQTVTATGRLSSTNPNLQNIPIRTERGREVRKAFVPKNKDYVLLAADYSQIELRLIAEVSKDNAMMEDFMAGLDIHSATAARVYDVSIDKVDSEMRRKAKMVNFGIIYGISPFGLGQRLDIKRTEAKALIDNYFEKYPGIKTYMDQSIAFAKEHLYVETIMGRKRYLKDIQSANATVRSFAERNAINAPIQGSAADLIKIAMINIQESLESESLKSKMILQVHDELIFDAYVKELDSLKHIVQTKMSEAIKTKVPLLVEMGVGANWLEAH